MEENRREALVRKLVDLGLCANKFIILPQGAHRAKENRCPLARSLREIILKPLLALRSKKQRAAETK
jgi:hypothetical protein